MARIEHIELLTFELHTSNKEGQSCHQEKIPEDGPGQGSQYDPDQTGLQRKNGYDQFHGVPECGIQESADTGARHNRQAFRRPTHKRS